MNILITRPSPKGEQLTDTLNQLGYRAYHAPLIEIKPGNDLPHLENYIAQLQPNDFIFALSPNAVEYAKTLNIHWPDTVNYVAIGQSSASELERVCHQAVAYPSGAEISENLLLLPQLQHIEGRHVLILRGNGGRELIGSTLSKRQAILQYCECYQRVLIDYDGKNLSNEWQEKEIDTIVVTSNEILQQLYNLIAPSAREWLISRRVIVVSDRIACNASRLGWSHIDVATSANNNALIQAIESYSIKK